MRNFIRPDIAFLKPYEAHLEEGNVKLDANENPFPWPSGMREELFSQGFSFNRYPDGSAAKVRESIGAYIGAKPEEILVGNGSDELIQIVLNTFGGRGRTLMIHPPTFSMYAAAAAITGTSVLEVPLKNGTGLDAANMLKSGTDVIIICNPNNPTGSLFPKEEILRIVQSSEALIVVDEAYAEFSGETMVNLIHSFPNLLIMRTFSKAFGMAALRLGYVVGNKELITSLNKVRQPFNVNTFSQQAGITALKYTSAYQEQIEMIKRETQMLYHELGQIQGIKVFPTKANFLLFQPVDPDRWAAALSAKGFTVRNLGQLPGLGKSLRMSSGTPEENQAFLKAIKEIAETEGVER
ncbi:MAG: Histidinol-phosphate aminotransferase 2 [Candidatus Dichloromethanomonas elyunquensis]|nr:MAG: Histidinol-phosphate aminotransferase 2 [Candidatus Dichloromethanomonas elyunquensis]